MAVISLCAWSHLSNLRKDGMKTSDSECFEIYHAIHSIYLLYNWSTISDSEFNKKLTQKRLFWKKIHQGPRTEYPVASKRETWGNILRNYGSWRICGRVLVRCKLKSNLTVKSLGFQVT